MISDACHDVIVSTLLNNDVIDVILTKVLRIKFFINL